MIQKLGKTIGHVLRPHGFRHRATTLGLDESGGDVRKVAAYRGDANTSTVLRYDDRRKSADTAAEIAQKVADAF